MVFFDCLKDLKAPLPTHQGPPLTPLLWSQIDSRMKIIRQAQALLAQRGTHLPTNSLLPAKGRRRASCTWWLVVGKSEMVSFECQKIKFVESFSLCLENRRFFVEQGVSLLILDFQVLRRRFAVNVVRERSLGDQQLQYKYRFSSKRVAILPTPSIIALCKKTSRKKVPYINGCFWFP